VKALPFQPHEQRAINRSGSALDERASTTVTEWSSRSMAGRGFICPAG
jgi:hypothetical protein